MRTEIELIVGFKKLSLFFVLQVFMILFASTSSVGQHCNLEDALPSITFSSTSARITTTGASLLRSVAQKLRNNPTCNLKVTSYGRSSKRGQQLSWEYVNAIINFLIEKEGISQERLIFDYGQDGGYPTVVDLRATIEEGPVSVPQPHPNLRRGK